MPLGLQDLVHMRQQFVQRERYLRYEADVHHTCSFGATTNMKKHWILSVSMVFGMWPGLRQQLVRRAGPLRCEADAQRA